MSNSEELYEFIKNLREKGISTYYSTFSNEAFKFGAKPLFTEVPDSLSVSSYWDYEDCVEALNGLTKYVSVEEAERRAIHLINPGLKDTFLGNSGILSTLYGGFQMIKPGDRAPSHRHTPANFRFIMQAPNEGAFTIINGYKIELHEGDLSAQIPWVWHEHKNEGNSDLVWFSGLDAPLISYLGAMFYSHPHNNEENFKTILSGEDSSLLNGSGFKSVFEDRSRIPDFKSSQNPLVYYPYKRTDSALNRLLEISKNNEPVSVEYENPTNGGSIFNSISLRLLRFKKDAKASNKRITENSVFTMFSGELEFEVEGLSGIIKANKGDVIAIPPWKKYTIVNNEKQNATVLNYSDAPIFNFLGLYREEN